MFKRRPSSVQILLALAEEEIVASQDGTGNLNGNYAALKERLSEMGVEITEDQSPEEMYREAARHFQRSKSTHQSESSLPIVAKVEAG